MLDDSVLIACLQKALAAENSGDLTTWASFLAEDVVVTVDGKTIAKNRDDLVRAVSVGRARGWTGQYTVSASARANVLTYHYFDTFVDGSIVHAAAVVRFDDGGKVVVLHALTSSSRPVESDAGGHGRRPG